MKTLRMTNSLFNNVSNNVKTNTREESHGIPERFEVINIDADKAKELLKRNIRNRALDKKTVERYAETMKRGEWAENFEPIQISEGGVLMNGQHRLEAIVKSGTTQRMLLCWGVKDKAFTTYDRLRPRTNSDILGLEGIQQPKYIASIIKSYIMLKRGNVLNLKGGAMSNPNTKNLKIYDADFTNTYNENPDLFQEVLKQSLKITKRLKGLFTASEMSAYMAYLILDKKHLQEAVIEFFEKLHDLSDVESMPITLLRERLVQNKMGNSRMTSAMKRALLIKAWNAWILKKDIKRLVWSDKEGEMKFV